MWSSDLESVSFVFKTLIHQYFQALSNYKIMLPLSCDLLGEMETLDSRSRWYYILNAVTG